MQDPVSLNAQRDAIRDHYLMSEDDLAKRLEAASRLTEGDRRAAQSRAADFVKDARANAGRSGLIDKFLQEYGLSTAEGVTLMRLAEALLRTPDAATADALIEDKIEAGDWASHRGKSPFPLVNFSTHALMATAAWLDDVEAKDPLRKMVAATKSILDRLGEPVIRASVGQAMRIMGEHFVLGQSIDEAMRRGRSFAAHGYLFSFDMLGEAAHTDADAQKYFADYKNAIAAIAAHSDKEKTSDNPGISVKLSALHPRYEYGKKERVLKELGARVQALALDAKAANMGFNIDAEEADRLDLSLDIIEQLMRDPALAGWDGFGVVVQAYQRRAGAVLDWLAMLARETGRRIMVRLVKGAYWDSEIKRAQVMGLESYPVFTRKILTDANFLACARKLFDATDVFYPQFATHNALTAAMVRQMAGDYSDYELQRLHGMGEALHDRLIDRGERSRIYAPVGGHKELLPYLVRRLLENGANSSFVNQLIDPDLSVDDIVADPLDEIASLESAANPAIGAPRDHLNGERLAARGWDETHVPTAAAMAPDARSTLGQVTAAPIINGKTITNGPLENVRNPANRNDIVGAVHLAGKDDVASACAAAKTFSAEWAATPADARGAILKRAADFLEERGDFFLALAVFEAGKSWPDAVAEVREAVDFLRYYANEAATLDGAPLGVVACISPWNFPLAIFLGQVSASLAAGNCVIAKPAEQTPLIAFEAVRVLYEAGIPAGALHYLPGDGARVGAPLAAHPDVAGVVFTGSTPTAQAINRGLAAAGKHDAALIAETGGVNAMIVDSTALLEQAVTDVVSSAFQSAGQRCSACRLVCVQADVADRFNEMLAGAMAELAVGDPARLATDVGPVIDADALKTIEDHKAGMQISARLIAEAPASPDTAGGSFVRPAAYELSALTDLRNEIFGPVLHVVRFEASDLEALVDGINALGFGLTMGLHSRIDDTMNAVARRARIGNVYVNRNQIGAVVGVQPFGGEGLSGTGPKAGGPHYLAALQQRAMPDAGDAPAIASTPLSIETKNALAAAEAAYAAWDMAPRGEILAKAADTTPPLTPSARIYEETFVPAATLPGPTGESNTLRLKGRGVVVCLGGKDENGDDALAKQSALALAAGNCALMLNGGEIAAALYQAGAPQGAAPAIDEVNEALLLDPRVRAIAFDGDATARAKIQDILVRREGAIIPILSSRDAPSHFATERTLTINTTAAGGDVRLLSLSD
ncbi:MAG: bifunctional proline dehydrogenase/L-glutamate gamma-semialdehyde dehydrogenase PutA [Pseudomonadota bacterium]